jgi:hypothetical protein
LQFGLAPLPRQSAIPAVITQGAATAPAAVESAPAAANPDDELREQILDVTLSESDMRSRTIKTMFSSMSCSMPRGLDKPARAIKGVLRFTDLFGEQKFGLKWTLEKPITCTRTTYTDKGFGFEYNQFTDSHQWVRNTEIENMKVKFRVDSILYEDGTTQTFD